MIQINDNRWCESQSYLFSGYWRKKRNMDKDRVVGSAKQVKGAVKQAVGKALGDTKLESEGKADKVDGRVQNAVGGLKDTVKDALKGK